MEKSLISNTDFKNFENGLLEICLLETVISNLISKKPWGCVRHTDPHIVRNSENSVFRRALVCVWYVWGVGVGLTGGGWLVGML